MGTDIGWKIVPLEQLQTLEAGGQYCVHLKTVDERFWAKGIITITERVKLPNNDFRLSFNLDLLIDGSPGIVDGYDND